jgi:hypothetical protein
MTFTNYDRAAISAALIVADNIKKAGWSLGWVSAIDSQGQTIWIVDAHRDGKHFIMHADEKLSAFVELERQVLTETFYWNPFASVTMTVIEIRPHRWGWKAFEAPGIEPVFQQKDQAIDSPQNRACFRSGQSQNLDSSGNVERTIAFSEADRKL